MRKKYMKHPKLNKFSNVLKSSCLSGNTIINPNLILNKTFIKRIVINLKLDDFSYNQIQRIFKQNFGLSVNKQFIADILREAGVRARHLNGLYDAMVKPRIKILEIDEIFQGRSNVFIGTADKRSRYLLQFKPLKNRQIPELKRILTPLLEHLDSPELIVTDGLKAYKTVIPEVFDSIPHLFCHVHALRVILREQDFYNTAANRALHKIGKPKKQLSINRKTLYNKRRKLKRYELNLSRLIHVRDNYYRDHGIRHYSKKIEWTPKLLYFKEKLNFYRTMIKYIKISIKTKKTKIIKLKKQLESLFLEYRQKQQISLQAGRLVGMFKRLLSCRNDSFCVNRNNFEMVLEKSSHPLAHKIKKFMKTNKALFVTKTPELEKIIKYAEHNTNIIEGIFGECRPILNKIRNLKNTDVSFAFLEIWRLKHNLSRLFTGIHNHECPLERCNIHSRYKTYLDALYPMNEAQTEEFKTVDNKWQKYNILGKMIICPNIHNLNRNPLKLKNQIKYVGNYG